MKPVESGAKVNVLRDFIGHLSYDAFNEGTRLQKGIFCNASFLGNVLISQPIKYMLPMPAEPIANKIISSLILFQKEDKKSDT